MNTSLLPQEMNHSNSSRENSRGFTLIEMIVSIGIFTIIMFIATSSFLAIVSADRKARVVRITTDNLNLALEDISRRIKTGTSYYCGLGGEAIDAVQDCAVTPSNTLFFTDQDGVRTEYTLINNAIWRTVGAEAAIQATSPEIVISGFDFYVAGTAPFPDTAQPKVTVVIDGNIGAGSGNSANQVSFKMQTSITQRAYDN